MTAIFDEPEHFATTALKGFCDVHSRFVHPAPGGALRATASEGGKVTLVIGGGSGHYPAFLGYVGTGFADAAVAGDVFASPSTQSVARICRLANKGNGILLGFGNYAGDVLNFGAAAERLRGEGVDVRILAVTDDVASAPVETTELRRGVAGDIVVFKIAGAAAEAGHNLNTVERLARHANARTQSLGIAFSGCRLPGADGPLFTVEKNTVAIGLGIHGEPGIRDEPTMPAARLADLLVEPLLAERPAGSNGRVAVILNGLGATKYEELFVLWTHVAKRLRAEELTLVESEVGEFVTSLDMAGCSLTLCWLDDELEPLWCAPADTVAFRRGASAQREATVPAALTADDTPTFSPADAASRQAAVCIQSCVEAIAAALADAEHELGRLDAIAGDGDHGQGMRRGSNAAAEAGRRALDAGAGAGSLLAAAGDAWADTAGGTSGAIWGLLLRAWGSALGDSGEVDAAHVAAGAKAAAEAVTTLGKAKRGDKTLVDALLPFVEELSRDVAGGAALADAWNKAAADATQAADATAQLSPKLGRARPLAARSVGHPDAGAVSLALCARVVGGVLARRAGSHHQGSAEVRPTITT